ncbi:MAG: sugar phosphate isomerase/epimerase [Armatimonadota bacterium]|nr:sugar phosphate isomerase/epimerase [Armatimonadota bacterium]
MKIGINHWTFPSGLSLAESFDLAKRAGCDHIEVNLAEEGELSLTTSESDVRAVAQAARDAGIEISSLSTGLYWKYSPTSNDAELRTRSLEIVQQQLKVATWLGVDTILVVPGAVTPEVSYNVAYDRAKQFVTDALPAARETGVAIGLENVWNKFLLSPLETRDFVDSFADPHVGVYFDAGNILAYGFPQHWIRILGPRIKKVHVKDFDSNIGGRLAFRNLLQGSVPWAEVRAALEEIGYDSYITAEVSGYNVHPELGLRHIADCLRAVFG